SRRAGSCGASSTRAIGARGSSRPRAPGATAICGRASPRRRPRRGSWRPSRRSNARPCATCWRASSSPARDARVLVCPTPRSASPRVAADLVVWHLVRRMVKPSDSTDRRRSRMNLHQLLTRRTETSGAIRVGVIGAGKFASMFLTQAVGSPHLHVVGVADVDVDKARAALNRTGWPSERYAAGTLEEALRTGATAVIDSADPLFSTPEIEVILEITGNPIVGTEHAVRAIDSGKHVIMVNVE